MVKSISEVDLQKGETRIPVLLEKLFGTGRSQAISRKNPKRGREEDHLLQSRTGSSPGHGFLCKHVGR